MTTLSERWILISRLISEGASEAEKRNGSRLMAWDAHGASGIGTPHGTDPIIDSLL